MSIIVVKFGAVVRIFYTMHHAEQMLRALRLNGTVATVEVR